MPAACPKRGGRFPGGDPTGIPEECPFPEGSGTSLRSTSSPSRVVSDIGARCRHLRMRPDDPLVVAAMPDFSSGLVQQLAGHPRYVPFEQIYGQGERSRLGRAEATRRGGGASDQPGRADPDQEMDMVGHDHMHVHKYPRKYLWQPVQRLGDQAPDC